jgi:hypothetical protein
MRMLLFIALVHAIFGSFFSFASASLKLSAHSSDSFPNFREIVAQVEHAADGK